MQYRVYNRQTLKYVDGGYVQEFNIDDDYIVNNNSTVSVVKKRNNTLSSVVVGDIIALIQDSGAYHKGVITAVDDTAFTISYKSDKELFNDNIPNPHSGDFAQDNALKIAGKFGVDYLIEILKLCFVDTSDKLKQLPIVFDADGDVLDENGEPKMLWTWGNDSINVVDWLTELFEKYNLSLSWDINFDISKDLTQLNQSTNENNNLNARHPQYVATFSSITKSGGVIKDNVAMQTMTYTVKELPDATVCRVIDSTSKQLLYVSSGINLLNPIAATKNTALVVNRKENNDGTVQVGFSEEENTRIDTSKFISFDYKSNYVISGGLIMGTTSYYIVAYNKEKKPIAYIQYRLFPSLPAKFNVNNFTFVNANSDLSDEELAKTIKYIKISYPNLVDVQLEKGDTPTEYDEFDKPAIYYLYEKNGEYSISTKSIPVLTSGEKRVLPVKTVIATFSQSSDGTDETSPEDVAKDKLIPSQFNQAIEIKINSDSKMFDFANAKFGDQYQIINEQGSVNSTFTGKKFSNKDKWATLYFGLGRQNYTDLMQIKLRKQSYVEVYND